MARLLRAVVFLSLVLLISAYNAEKVRKISFGETVEHLYALTYGNFTTLEEKFDIKAKEERDQFRDDLIKLLYDHYGHQSWFARMAGLVTFKNILLVLTVAVGVIFIVSLCKDILILVGGFLWDIITTKAFLYTIGYGLSLTCFFKPELITQWSYLDFFEQFFPLFGLILFSTTLYFTLSEISGPNFYCHYSYFLNFLWILASLKTQISFMGTLTVVLTFHNIGFLMAPIYGGYQTGFDERENLYRCLVLSIALNSTLIYAKITAQPLYYFEVFETGIQFWGTLVGCIAILIASSNIYWRSRVSSAAYLASLWFAQLVSAAFYLLLMYFGTIFSVASYTSIGGTFLFLFFLDIQYLVLIQFKTDSMTGLCFVLLVNLYALKQLINSYPEYFLFMT